MADLENLLLEAAGRTNAGGRNHLSNKPSRRHLRGSHSDDGKNSKDDDSDYDHGYGSRKPSGPQVPLKKRLDPPERDYVQGSQDGDEDDYGHEGDSGDDSVGSDLYKDDHDREELAQLTELEREMILSERATKKDDKKLQEVVRSKWSSEKKAQSRKEASCTLSSSRGVRSSARSADRASAKDDALNELRAKRLKQQDPEAQRKLRDPATKGASGSCGVPPTKRKHISAAGLSSSSQSESESASHSEDDDSTGDGMADSDDEGPQSNVLTFEDIKAITIRRSKLTKWLMEPFFDELIVGCFVRVGIGKSRSGPIYRLCTVRNVDGTDPDRPYKLENKMTHKYLNCVWGNESSAARWQMAMVSDSTPLKEEFDQWKREVERSGGRMPSKQDVSEKREAIEKTNTYVYSAATVKQMLQEKKSATSRPLNVAAEKDRLRREMDVAESKHDMVEVKRIKARLEELEACCQTQVKDSKAVRLAEMNRKNRVENFKNASGLKPFNTGLKAGEVGYDPFSRRWTRSTESDFRNYFEQFGAITDLVVMYDPNTQRPRGFGFITYDSEEAVDRVLVKTFHELNGKMVEVKRAIPKELSPGPTRSPLCGYNYGLNRVNSFLNCYSQGYTPSGIGGFGVRMDGRFSPIANTRSGFPPFGSGYGMGLNFEPGLSPSYMGSGSFSNNMNYGRGPNPYYVNNSNRFGSPIGCDGGSGGSSLFTSATRDSLRNGSLSYGTNSAKSNAYVGSGNGSTGGNTFGSIGVNLGASPMSAQAARNTSAHSENLSYGISDNNAYAVQLGGYGRNTVSSGYGRPFGDFYGNSSAYGETTRRSINCERDGPVSFGFGVENAASEISAKGTLGYVGDYAVSQRQSAGGIAV